MSKYSFPFGQELKRVQQSDEAPGKKVFVLGVYASAVHARWVGANKKQKVKALAVASEPYIFWRGDFAEQIISSIKLPKELGWLEPPANRSLNGPSSVALDNLFLTPLGFVRKQAWLCDLLPESRVNPKQRKAINKFYSDDIIKQFKLSPATVPDFDNAELDSPVRRKEILEELEASQADTIILLGSLPIKWFLHFHDKRFSKLSQFGDTDKTYGRQHEIKINGKVYNVIPLCQPGNAARLGTFSKKWAKLHDNWTKEKFSRALSS